MRRAVEIGAFHVEWQNSLHVWIGSRGLHVFWRDAGLNEPQHRVGRLVVVPDRAEISAVARDALDRAGEA